MLSALPGIFAGVLRSLYQNGTLWRRPEVSDDGSGSIIVAAPDQWPSEAVSVQIEAATTAMRQAEGYSDRDVRLLILASGIARPSTDDEVSVAGIRYALASVGQDPAQAYWECRGRPL